MRTPDVDGAVVSDAAMLSNAAAQAFERVIAWSAIGEPLDERACLAPSMVFDDRRQGVLHPVKDRSALAALLGATPFVESGSDNGVLSTIGDRLALYRYRCASGDHLIEVDSLSVIQVDVAGWLVSGVALGGGDLRAAADEVPARAAAARG